MDPGCFSRILTFTHPEPRVSDPPDPKTATKRGVKIFCWHTFFVATNSTIENYFIFEMLKKKIWANFQKIAELCNQKIVTNRVSDPHWFNADTDPAFFVIANPEFSWSKIAIYLSLGLHKGRPRYRRSLQPSKENIQYLKTWKFWTFFLFLWVIFALLDPDPDPQFECGSGYSHSN